MGYSHKKPWVEGILLAFGIFFLFSPDIIGAILCEKLFIFPEYIVSIKLDFLTLEGQSKTLMGKLLGIVLSLPMIINRILWLSKYWILRKVPNETKDNLWIIIDKLTKKKDRIRFFGETYIRRGICPVIALQQDEDPHFVMLIRGLEEVRAYSSGEMEPERHFENLQENDYQRLFEAVKESYYVTSFGDHIVWVIFENSDLEYYQSNYLRDRKLKKYEKWKKKIHPRYRGINRIFILGQDYANTIISQDQFIAFKGSLNNFLDDLPKPFYNLAQAVGIDANQPNITIGKQFKGNLIIQLLFVLLAAKIHEKLSIKFSVLRSASLSSEQMDHLLLNRDDLHHDWNSIGWTRLGSAMFDNFMVAYADMKQEQKSIIYYKFKRDINETFENEANYLLTNNSYIKYNSLDADLCNFIQDDEFNRISEQLAIKISS